MRAECYENLITTTTGEERPLTVILFTVMWILIRVRDNIMLRVTQTLEIYSPDFVLFKLENCELDETEGWSRLGKMYIIEYRKTVKQINLLWIVLKHKPCLALK